MSPRRSTHLEFNHDREQRDSGSRGHTKEVDPELDQHIGNYVCNQQQPGQYDKNQVGIDYRALTTAVTEAIQTTSQHTLMERQKQLLRQQLLNRVLLQKNERDTSNYFIQMRQSGVRTFTGDSNALEAHSWLDEIEQSFKLMRVSEDMRLEIVRPLLVSNASEWWKSREPTMEKANRPITWQQFREAFLDHYFSLTQQLEYRTEFENIKQRQGESVEAFINRFDTLLKFSSEIMNSDLAKASKFKNALLGEIRTMVALQDMTYKAMTDGARKSEIEVKLRQTETKGQRYSSSIFLGQGSRCTSLSKAITSHRYLRPTGVGFKRSIGSTQITNRHLLYQHSQHYHKGECYKRLNTCFGSGSRENQYKNCPNPQGVKTYGMDSFGTSTATTSIPAQKESQKDNTNAKIFKMTQSEVDSTNDVVTDTNGHE